MPWNTPLLKRLSNSSLTLDISSRKLKWLIWLFPNPLQPGTSPRCLPWCQILLDYIQKKALSISFLIATTCGGHNLGKFVKVSRHLAIASFSHLHFPLCTPSVSLSCKPNHIVYSHHQATYVGCSNTFHELVNTYALSTCIKRLAYKHPVALSGSQSSFFILVWGHTCTFCC